MRTSNSANTLPYANECDLVALVKAAERTGDDPLKQQLERVIEQIHQEALAQRALEAVKCHDLAGFFGDMPLRPKRHEIGL